MAEEPDIHSVSCVSYADDELLETFKGVADPSDWQAPIKAVIPLRMFGEIATAVETFTGTKLRIVELLPERMVRVRADGFRAGPVGK
jgi:hypothetical protein